MQSTVLEQIALQNGCLISDLRSAHTHAAIVANLRNFPWQEYSLEDCSYSLSYILGSAPPFTSLDDVKSFVCSL